MGAPPQGDIFAEAVAAAVQAAIQVSPRSPGWSGRVALLMVDELGFVTFERAGCELLFNLLADRDERRSTSVTTGLAFSEWVRVFGDERPTTALLDRLGHHAPDPHDARLLLPDKARNRAGNGRLRTDNVSRDRGTGGGSLLGAMTG